MISKLWAKFNDEGNVECLCDEHHKKCTVYPGGAAPCKEYIAKFIEIDRTEEEAIEKVEEFGQAVKKFERDLKNKLKKMNQFKVR